MKKLAAISLVLFAGLVNAQEILIFGGDNNKEFLGCLTCNEMAGNSVWNEMSTYGWKNGYGKWNPYGQFKNPYSSYSACNEYTSNGPEQLKSIPNCFYLAEFLFSLQSIRPIAGHTECHIRADHYGKHKKGG